MSSTSMKEPVQEARQHEHLRENPSTPDKSRPGGDTRIGAEEGPAPSPAPGTQADDPARSRRPSR